MMDKCLQCGAELEHIEGRRKKKFCKENCRVAFWHKNNKKKEPQFVRYKTFKDLSDKFNDLMTTVNTEKKQDVSKSVCGETVNITITEKDHFRPDEKIDVAAIKERIDILKKEIAKPPKNLMFPERVYIGIRKKEISELEAKLR